MARKADDPLRDLWESLVRALRPFGVRVGPEILQLWRGQWEARSGVFWAAERGHTAALDEAIRMLQELRGPDPDDGEASAD